MHSNPLRFGHHLIVARRALVGRAYRNVVGRNPQEIEAFLNSNADGAATAPKANQEVGFKARLCDRRGQLE